jgi:hypothetical protein
MVCLESLGYFPPQARTDIPVPRLVRFVNRVAGSRNVAIVSDPHSIGFGLRFTWAFLCSGHFPCVPVALPRWWLPEIALSDHRVSYWD